MQSHIKCSVIETINHKSIWTVERKANITEPTKIKMRTLLILASVMALALALPAKVKRDAPYPAALPIPVPHDTYGPPEVKLVEHDEDCVADGRWLNDVHDKKWNDVPETFEYKVEELPKPVETTIVHHPLPVTHIVEHELPKPIELGVVAIHTLPEKPFANFETHVVHHNFAALPVLPTLPILHSEYGPPPPPPVEEVKFEVPTLHSEYGPPPVEEVKLFPYPAAVPLVKVEEHDEDCVVDGRWINDLGKKYE
jgi:hypothetical protein